MQGVQVQSLVWSESRSVVSDSWRPHGLYSSWNSPAHNTGVGSYSTFQGIFPTQGSNPGLLLWRQILSHQGSPQSLAGELKFHMPHGVAQKIPKTKHIKNHSEGFASLEDSFQYAKPQEGREGKLTFIRHLKCGCILTHKIDVLCRLLY